MTPNKTITASRPLKNRKGVALLLAIFSIMLLTFVVTEVTYDTQVEYITAANRVDRLKAYYAAKSGVELSLLRILIYKQAMATYGDQLGAQKSLLDPIWQLPFAWPPILPDNMTTVSKDEINKTVAESTLDAQYLATIESEGGKIDLNDLASPVKSLAESTKQQIVQIFSRELENNDDFKDKHSGEDFQSLVNRMVDWVDENQERVEGGSEKDDYQDDLSGDTVPPNQPFKTISELHLIKGMKDDFFKLLESRVTVYGTKGINVNYAPKEVLQALDRQMTDEVVQRVIERRNNPDLGGLFANADDFLGFISGYGVNSETFNEAGVPLLFDAEYNFRITAIGQSKKSSKEISVITYDFDTSKDRFIELLDKQEEKEKGTTNSNTGTNTNTNTTGNDDTDNEDDKKAKDTKKIKMPSGRPRVVYWKET
ncbi:MAG: general secretion pathway protein GspK [Pseudobdellovibrionaceae bacterium]|nr:MAG: general secretion pathway protein GspK [Pseudobdellovibrionaceae bacterium]